MPKAALALLFVLTALPVAGLLVAFGGLGVTFRRWR